MKIGIITKTYCYKEESLQNNSGVVRKTALLQTVVSAVMVYLPHYVYTMLKIV